MDFTSRQLRAFLLVAQHRSFTRAAELMFITPSGLSALIREFENELGDRLFNRTTRHVALTRSGADMVKIAQESLQRLEGMASRIGHSAGEANQSFSMGAPHLIAANIVAPAIKEFRVHHAGFRIELFDERAPLLLPMVQEGKLDMGLGIFARAAGIRRSLFLRFPLMVIRPEVDQDLKRGSMTWSALKGETLISLQPASPIQQLVDRNLSHAGIKLAQKVHVNLLDTQMAMVEAGEGIAVVPSYALLASRARRVVMSRLINPVADVEFSLISYRGRKLPSVALAFTDFLKSYFSRWQLDLGITHRSGSRTLALLLRIELTNAGQRSILSAAGGNPVCFGTWKELERIGESAAKAESAWHRNARPIKKDRTFLLVIDNARS